MDLQNAMGEIDFEEENEEEIVAGNVEKKVAEESSGV